MHIFSKAFYSITLRYPILFFDNVHIKAHAIYRKARVSIFLRQHIPVVQLEQYQLYNSSYTSCTTGIVRVAHPVASLLKRYPYRLRKSGERLVRSVGLNPTLSAIILLFVRLPHKWSHQKRRDAPRNKNLRHISFFMSNASGSFLCRTRAYDATFFLRPRRGRLPYFLK